MDPPDARPDRPLTTLEYVQHTPESPVAVTPEQERGALLLAAGIATAVTLAYWSGMFWTCRPALHLFCIGPFLPWMLTSPGEPSDGSS